MVRHDLYAIADSDLRWNYTDVGNDFRGTTVRIDVGPIAGGAAYSSGTSASTSGLRAVINADNGQSIEIIMPDSLMATVLAAGGRARYNLRVTYPDDGADNTISLASGVLVVRAAVGTAA